MNYLDALVQLDAAAEHIAQTTMHRGWRLRVQDRHPSRLGPCLVELQHWEGERATGGWWTVANVSCDVRADGHDLRLVTSINCTMCGRWSTEGPKASGLQKLFEVADMFESFTAGKIFEA